MQHFTYTKKFFVKTCWQFLIKSNIFYNPVIARLGIYPTEMETYLSSHRNPYPNVYSSFIPNSPKLETIQTAFNGRMVKQTVVHSNQGLRRLSNKKERATDTCSDLDGSFMLSEKSQAQNVKYILYVSIHMTFLK